MFGASFIPVTFAHHVITIFNYKYSLYLKITYLISFLMSLMSLTDSIVLNVGPVCCFRFWAIPGDFFSIYLFLWFAIFISPWFFILKTIRSNNKNKNIAKFIFFASLIGVAGGATNFFLWYRIPILPYGNVMVVVYICVIWYLIFKHQFFNISIVIKKSVVYSLLITSISFIYLLSVFLFETIANIYFQYNSTIGRIFIAFSLGLILVPVKNKIELVIDKIFYKSNIVDLSQKNELLIKEIVLNEKYRFFSHMVAAIVHEIRNPLTAIQVFCEHVPKKKNDLSFISKFEEVTSSEFTRINTLLEDVISFVKPSKLIKNKVSVSLIIENTIRLVKPKADNIEFITSYCDDDLVYVDKDQIKQVFLNLLINAIEAMPNGGKVWINSNVESDNIVINIRDNGPGIPSDIKEKIFELFVTYGKEKGTGLGLAVTKQIIDNHDGKISLDTKCLKGACFKIYLPKNLINKN